MSNKNALAKSFFDEADKIEKRRSIWLRLHTDKWAHIYHPILVNDRIKSLREQGDYYYEILT